jgi:hypothetical protein
LLTYRMGGVRRLSLETMKQVPGSARRDALARLAWAGPALRLAFAPSAGLPASIARLLALGVAAPALAACSPTYDWREVRAEDGASMVLMPAKPAKLTRPIDLGGLKVEMAMQGARAEDNAFTLASVQLPDDSEATRRQAIEAMRLGMVRNIGGTERAVRELTVPIVDPTGKALGTAPAIEIEATGRMKDRDAVLMARFVAVGAKAWQCVVLGPAVEREHAQTFLRSFRLVRA